jgi:hypothetical protein
LQRQLKSKKKNELSSQLRENKLDLIKNITHPHNGKI